jgi:hypothetical protein
MAEVLALSLSKKFILFHIKIAPVGNVSILCQVQEKEGNEGRKTDYHEKRSSSYIWNMLGLWNQDVQDRGQWCSRRRHQSQSQKGRG